LIEFRYPGNGKTGKGQLSSPNYTIQEESTYYEKYKSGHTLIFRVNSRYFVRKLYIDQGSAESDTIAHISNSF